MPFCCSILKVSVATRWPLTKMPNEPESTVRAAAGLGLSFLSAAWAPAKAARAEAKITAAARRIPVSNFTRLLLVRWAARFSSSPGFRQSQRRSFPPCGRRFGSAGVPASTHCAESGRGRETPPRYGARDALRRFRWLARNSAAISLLPERPEKPWTRRIPSAALRFPSARKLRPQGPQFWRLRRVVREAHVRGPRARLGETRILPNPGKFPLPYALPAPRCGRPDLQRPNSAAVRGRGPHWFSRPP